MAHAMRAEIICKKAALRTATGTASETKLRQEMDKLLSVLKKKEKEQEDFVLIGQDFYDDLKEMVSKSVCCDKIQVLQSMFQADTTIARACIQKKCDIAFMCDTDLAAYAGKSCLGIEDFRITKGSNKNPWTIVDASIFTASREAIMDICEATLHFQALEKTKATAQKEKTKVPFIIDAIHPLFDQVDNPHLHALYAVTTGFDVFPGGIFGLGASKIISATKQQQAINGGKVEFNQLVHYFAGIHQKSKMCGGTPIETVEAMILAYVDAFLFEPANAMKDGDTRYTTNKHDGEDGNTTIIVLPEYVSETPSVLPTSNIH